jgi:hypothetical protein
MSVASKRSHPIYLAAAWLFLHLLINIDPVSWPPSWLRLLQPSLDVWAVLLLVSVWASWGKPFKPRFYLPLVLGLVFLRFFRLGDELVPAYLSRPFNAYMDVRYMPDLLHLLVHSFAGPILAVYGLMAALLMAVMLAGIRVSLQLAYDVFATGHCRRVFWGLAAAQSLLMGLYLLGEYPARWPAPATTCAVRIAQEAAFIFKIGEIKRRGLSAVQLAASRMPRFAAPLKGLHRTNVHFFIVESYGYTLFADPRRADRFKGVMKRLETHLAEAGYHACSNFINSPTFGGRSWLAFGTLETGVWVSDQLKYNLLLNSAVRPLAEYFKRAGYRTVSVMPGTTMPWPEGGFLKYAHTYYAKDFDYDGPTFSWSPMPDQFVLARIYAREVAPHPTALFVRYFLTSTHSPFNRQPPYIEDWDRIDRRGEIYRHLAPITFPFNWPDMTHAAEAYLSAMIYDMTVLQAYLRDRIKGDALIIIVGDHQPIAQVTGPGRPSWVPIHILSRNRAFLEPFIRMGYTSGMIPRSRPPYKGMDTFMADFLRAFSQGADGGP